MTVVRSAYRLFTAAAIKSRADIPDQADMTIVGTTVECNYITKTKIKTVLGSASNLDSELCTHASVNHWSAFGPTVRSFSGGSYARELVNSDPTANYQKGSFAGYNHEAVTPGWQTGGQASAEADIWVNTGSNATINAPIDLGEIDYHTDHGAHGVVMLIFDSFDAIVGWGQTELATVGDAFTMPGVVESVAIDHLDYYGMIFLVDTYPIAQSEDVISSVICRVPNISTFEVNLKVKAATYLTVLNNGLTVEGAGFNSTAGTCGFTKFYHVTNSYTNVYVTARLLDWLGNQVGSSVVMYNDAYTAGDEAFPTTNPAKPDGDPIDSFGYQFIIEFSLTL